jgi:hypothetical protein
MISITISAPSWQEILETMAIFMEHVRTPTDCSECPDLKCEYSANMIWYCKHDPRYARCNAMLRPGGDRCVRKPVKGATQESAYQTDNSKQSERSARQQSQDQSCAYCGKDLSGLYQWHDMNRVFCDKYHADKWYENPSRCPTSRSLLRPDISPSSKQSPSLVDPAKLQGIVADILKSERWPDEILYALHARYGIDISVGELASVLVELA